MKLNPWFAEKLREKVFGSSLRMIIQVDPERMENAKAALRAVAGISVIKQSFDYITVEAPTEAIPLIERIPGVIMISYDMPTKIFQIPVFEELGQWLRLDPLSALAKASIRTEDVWPTAESRTVLGADEAEAERCYGHGIKVAVLDTGYYSHIQLGLKEFRSATPQVLGEDENGHSTHCTTTIAGSEFTDPFGLTAKGVAPNADVLLVKVLGGGIGAGTMSDVMEGMMIAFEWGADIINMSLGSEECQGGCELCPECRAIKMLTEQGIIVVVANGNSGVNTQGCPACSPSALSVGAIDKYGKIADFSSRGKLVTVQKPDVVAPGVNIWSGTTGLIDLMTAADGFNFGAISGTSMATPHASGIVVLIRQLYKTKGINLTTDMIKDMMKKYGEPWSTDYGYGVLTWDIAKKYLEDILAPRPAERAREVAAEEAAFNE